MNQAKKIRVFHPEEEKWLDIYYSDKIYNTNHLAILAYFTTKDIASMAYNPYEEYICTRIKDESIMVTKDAIYVAKEYFDGVKIKIIKNFKRKNK